MIIAPGSGAQTVAPDRCVDGESTYTDDTLHDLRSFADAVAVVEAVKEAGLIGRHVTFRVERVLWRRPHAPRPPSSARFNDLGWWGEPDDRTPMYVCGETRMELGRRYLAPIVRHHGTWYPIFSARLLLDGDRVVGGVDGGEPTHAHQALAGRRVPAAVRLLARTSPYRAVVRDPSGSPARRWSRVDEDDYRVWREPFPDVVVESGVTERSRWHMYARERRRGGLCLGMSARPLWGGAHAPGGEACGPRRIPRDGLQLALFSAHRRGLFAYGSGGSAVWAVRARFGAGDWRRVDTTPPPHGLHARQRFWAIPSDGGCARVRVQALGRGDRVLRRLGPYAAC